MRRTVVSLAPSTRGRLAPAAAFVVAAALAAGQAACSSGVTEPSATVLRPPLLDPNPGVASAIAPAAADSAGRAAGGR